MGLEWKVSYIWRHDMVVTLTRPLLDPDAHSNTRHNKEGTLVNVGVDTRHQANKHFMCHTGKLAHSSNDIQQ